VRDQWVPWVALYAGPCELDASFKALAHRSTRCQLE
jgi:hypothetical protein